MASDEGFFKLYETAVNNMEKSKKAAFPAYRKIALNIAQNIVDGKYIEGQKLSGRTVLASHYNVSPETIRKAVYLLKDAGILDIEKNSGVLIRSVRDAGEFIRQNHEMQSVADVKSELFAWMDRQISKTESAMEKMQFIINTSEHFKKSTPFVPYEIVVPANSGIAGRSIRALNFWHNTRATIIAIARGALTILSPGPYSCLLIGDILYIVGDEQALRAAIHFVTSGDDAAQE
jgi:K+/H+ antiporter YhaU regulatory subunit KhtT